MRIVSLCPSVTELIADLGADADLVGITRYCSHPTEVAARVEHVGGTKDPDIDRIVALAPDLVFMNIEENRVEDADALIAAGLRCLFDLPKTIEETATMVRRVGDAIRRSDAAERIARDIETRAARVRRDHEGAPPLRWAYLIWRKPYMAAGDDTFVDTLLSLAGGHNVFAARSERYPAITIDELAAATPDVVFLATEPFPFEPKHIDELRDRTGWPAHRFAIVNGQDLSWHGSRTPRGIDYAEQVIVAASEALLESK